jgi:hypothetical protein
MHTIPTMDSSVRVAKSGCRDKARRTYDVITELP